MKISRFRRQINPNQDRTKDQHARREINILKTKRQTQTTRARMHGKEFCYPVGKRYPEGSYLGGKNLGWFACMGHGRAGR